MDSLNSSSPFSINSANRLAQSTPVFGSRLLATTDSVQFGATKEQAKKKAKREPILQQIIRWVMKKLNGLLNWGARKRLKNITKVSQEKIDEILNAPAAEKIDRRDFTRPSTGVAKATHTFNASHPIMKKYKDWNYLGILEDYGAKWSRFKVARDTLQNFYDGQGQTLEDTSIEVKAAGAGKQTIKIKASATYNVDNLLGLGAGTKRNDAIAAGENAEGTKMVALCLLRDYGADKVIYRSGEWQAEFELKNPGEEHTTDENIRGLMVKLTPLDKPLEGNEFEVTTRDKALVETFKDAKSFFYNKTHEPFKTPTYENATGGFKLTDGSEDSRYYEAGQLRAVGSEQNFDALPGISVWTNQKLLESDNRDRVAVQPQDIEESLNEIVGGMSFEETKQGIEMLRKEWFHATSKEDLFDMGGGGSGREVLLGLLCQHAAELAKGDKSKLDFIPKGLVTVDSRELLFMRASEDWMQKVLAMGYIPVKPALGALGVPSGRSVLKLMEEESENSIPRVGDLTPQQENRLSVFKDALDSITDSVASMPDGRYYARRLRDISKKEIVVVDVPDDNEESKNRSRWERNSSLFVSKDGSQIFISKQLLETKSFSEFLGNVQQFCEHDAHLFSGEMFNWVINSLDSVQKLKAAWEGDNPKAKSAVEGISGSPG